MEIGLQVTALITDIQITRPDGTTYQLIAELCLTNETLKNITK